MEHFLLETFRQIIDIIQLFSVLFFFCPNEGQLLYIRIIIHFTLTFLIQAFFVKTFWQKILIGHDFFQVASF